MNSILHLALFTFQVIYLNLGRLRRTRNGPWRLSYLTAELPHAPCLSVRRFIIFWINWVAVTWSRYLAALIKWSHIFSSSRLSAEYWAHNDWKGEKKIYELINYKSMDKKTKMYHETIFRINQTNQNFNAKFIMTIKHWLI